MKETNDKIKQIAKSLFAKGQVNIFMGWQEGDFTFQPRPFFARSEQDTEQLIFNDYCIYNLSNALLKFRDGHEKIGLLVKGCDSRGIVRLLEDLQIKRERLYIVGVCCPGMKDPLQAMRNRSRINPGDQHEELAAKCQGCLQPNPIIFDERIGSEQAPRVQGERFAKVKEIEALSPDERYQFFEEILSKCIRCYGCRQACVACDCRTCIFDETKPQWVGRETSTSDNFMYHLVKALHMAGRCIECGECERVCPVNIPLMLINQKLIKDVNNFYGPYEAGMEYVEGAKPPLSVYKENDPDDFL